MLTALLLPALGTAFAANATWANGGNGNWNDTANWSPASVPLPADSAIFRIGTNTAVSLNGADRSITNIFFTGAAGNFVISASAAESLLLQSGGKMVVQSGLSGVNLTQTVSAPITLGGNYSFINERSDPGTKLVVSGNITNSATSTLTLGNVDSVTGNGTGNLISGNISDGVGVQSLTFTHSLGAWALSGSNSYSGLTLFSGNGGTSILRGQNSSAGATTVTGNNAVVQFDSDFNGGLASGLLTLSGGFLQAATKSRSISNEVLVAGNARVSGDQDLTITGKMTGNTGAARTLTNNIASGKTLKLGDIDISNDTGVTARTFTIAGTGNTMIDGVIADGVGTTTANLLSITNTGTTILNGANTYTGATTMNSAGTVILNGSLSGPGAITTAGIFTQSSTGEISGTKGFTVGANSTATLGGLNTYSGATSVNQSTATLILSGTITNSFIVIGNNGTFTQTSTGLISGTKNFTISSGTSTLGAANTYSGVTTVNGGVLNFVNGGLGSGNVTSSGGTLQYATGNTQDISGKLQTGGSGGIKLDVNGNDVVFGTNLVSASSNQGISVISTAPGGSLTLTGPQQYTGTTVIGTAVADSGTLKLAAASSLAAGGNNNQMQILGGGTFDLNGNDQILSVLANDGTITNSGTGTATLTLGSPTVANQTGAGRFTGALNIVWNQLAASGAFTGTVGFAHIGNLTLNANGVGTIGVAAANNSGMIINSGTGTALSTISGVIGASVTGVNQNSATSGLILSGANTYTSATTITAGTLTANNAGVAGVSGALGLNSAVSIANTATANLALSASVQIGSLTGGGVTGGNVQLGANVLTTGGDNTSPAAFGGVISGVGGSVTKIGTGTQTLSGANTYTGATTVTAGTLLISAGNINSSAVTVASGAKFTYNSGVARTAAITLNGIDSSNRATLGGVGPINVAVTLDSLGDTLSPGNSPGFQSYGTNQVWNSFTYVWETNNFSGTTAGTDFDQIAITGSLDLTGGIGAYNLDIYSLTAGNVTGDVPNFSELSTSWTILTASGGITNFDAGNWTVLTANFTSDPAWAGTWSVTQSGSDLVLNYTVVPEPGTFALVAAGLAAVGLIRRRKVSRP